ncbi:MAG TPA: hypothetical protein VMC10_08040 [Stellaceae bacterium]|nr:hypothetical protein [Stellaceae bacterium]
MDLSAYPRPGCHRILAVAGMTLCLLMPAAASAAAQPQPAPAQPPSDTDNGTRTMPPAPGDALPSDPANGAAHGVVHPPPTGDEGGVVTPPQPGAGNGATPVIPPPGTEKSPDKGVDPR